EARAIVAHAVDELGAVLRAAHGDAGRRLPRRELGRVAEEIRPDLLEELPVAAGGGKRLERAIEPRVARHLDPRLGREGPHVDVDGIERLPAEPREREEAIHLRAQAARRFSHEAEKAPPLVVDVARVALLEDAREAIDRPK